MFEVRTLLNLNSNFVTSLISNKAIKLALCRSCTICLTHSTNKFNMKYIDVYKRFSFSSLANCVRNNTSTDRFHF